MEAKLIKIDKNGSKHFEGWTACDRCGGSGIYTWGAVINGRPQYAGTCFKCEGRGKVLDTWIERTPEYQAKLDAKRAKKAEARRAEWAAWEAQQAAEREAARKAEEAERAISQHVGQAGEKVEIQASYIRTGSWEQKAFRGYGTETMYCHTFKDEAGNVFTRTIWPGAGHDQAAQRVQGGEADRADPLQDHHSITENAPASSGRFSNFLAHFRWNETGPRSGTKWNETGARALPNVKNE